MIVEKQKDPEKVILIGVGLKSENLENIKESLNELFELAETAGAEVVGSLTQIRDQWTPATLIGKGKLEEIKETLEETKANSVIIDRHLSGIQQRNLEKILEVPVLDRTQLILLIFSQRAQTSEGKLQVELAQLSDQYSRMVGGWLGSLSRLGGGIGTRGPGEKAIEFDRRAIRRRINKIKENLENIKKHRAQHRTHRKRNQIPSFALIGYTNAGKSSLLSKLTNAKTLVEDQLFATLDPKTRKVFLPNGPHAVVTDTVGFIRNLPTELVESFKATLEESADADVLLHVIDLSNPSWEQHFEIVEKLMDDFGWTEKPILYIFNKLDQAPIQSKFKVNQSPRVFVSAKTGEGFDELKEKMIECLNELYEEYELFFPLEKRFKVYELGREAQINTQEESQMGIVCKAHLTPQLLTKWSEFLIK